MKWFKHDTTARNDTRIKLLKKKFGAEGYGVYFQLLEIIGENIKEKNHDEWSFVEDVHTIETLADESGVKPDKLRAMLLYMNQIGLVYKINGKLSAPKILTRLDEYATRRKGDFNVFERKKEIEGQYRDSVGTISGIRTEEKRREEKRTEEEEKRVIPNNVGIKKYTTLEGLDENDFINISNKYDVPLSFVKSKYDDLFNYCGAKGKIYKNYYLALTDWVKRDSIKIRKEEHGKSKLTIIDPDPNWKT